MTSLNETIVLREHISYLGENSGLLVYAPRPVALGDVFHTDVWPSENYSDLAVRRLVAEVNAGLLIPDMIEIQGQRLRFR